jgi:hypothetical protein
VKPRLKPDAYTLAAEAVEAGIAYGWQRAHKHTDTPDPETIRSEIERAVMNELAERFTF